MSVLLTTLIRLECGCDYFCRKFSSKLMRMGIITSCCKPSASEVLTPDAETRRRQQVEAAERRRNQEASRGVKDPEKVRRMQERAEEIERREQELRKEGGATLKWTAD